MKYKLLNTSKKLKLKIFISLALCIASTMIILSTVLYSSFLNVATNQICLANMNNLDQISTEVSIMSNVAVTIAMQLSQDVPISKLQYSFQPDIYDLSIAQSQMRFYRMTIPFIDSIYVYNGYTDTVYAEAGAGGALLSKFDDFADKQSMDIIKNYKNYKPYIPIPRKYIYASGTEKYYYSFLMYDVMSKNSLGSAIMVNISEDWIHKVINNAAGDTFAIDRNGILVSNGPRFPIMSDFSNIPYIKNILNSPETQGSFEEVIEGDRSLVVFTKPDDFGWRYVRILKWGTLFKNIEYFRTVTIIVGVCILLFGILISLFISGRLYLPIAKMSLNLEHLELEKRNNNKVLRQEFLRNLILGRDLNSKEDIRESFNRFGFNFGLDSRICTLLLKIDRYKSFIQQFDMEDRNLYKFAIANIAGDILSSVGKTEAVDMGSDSMVIIINKDMENLERQLVEYLKSIQTSVLEFLKLSISITINHSTKSVENIHQQFNELMESSLHRVFHGHGCILFTQEIIQYKSKDYIYPMNKEKLLIDSIMSGKMVEARKMYNEIIEETYTQPITVFTLTISHLMFTLNSMVNTIKSNNAIFEGLVFNIPAIMLSEIETIDEINNHFDNLFTGIEKCLEEKKNTKHDTIIQRINEIINQQYFNSGLSVDSIAISIGMSTPYICRIYKQYTLHTILEEIVKVRMEKARNLLLETSDAIEEIAEKVGFSNSNYFYKAFKTVNGLTPREYRRQKSK